MSRRVSTTYTTTCDRCGETKEDKSNHPSKAAGWRSLGANTTDGTSWRRDICPKCFTALEKFLKG